MASLCSFPTTPFSISLSDILPLGSLPSLPSLPPFSLMSLPCGLDLFE